MKGIKVLKRNNRKKTILYQMLLAKFFGNPGQRPTGSLTKMRPILPVPGARIAGPRPNASFLNTPTIPATAAVELSSPVCYAATQGLREGFN